MLIVSVDYQSLLDKIMKVNQDLRFATICDLSGDIKWISKRDGVTLLLSLEDTKKMLKQAVHSWKTRNEFSSKLGKGMYVIAAYENLRRLTMPLGKEYLLLATFDNKSNQVEVIDGIQNILPA